MERNEEERHGMGVKNDLEDDVEKRKENAQNPGLLSFLFSPDPQQALLPELQGEILTYCSPLQLSNFSRVNREWYKKCLAHLTQRLTRGIAFALYVGSPCFTGVQCHWQGQYTWGITMDDMCFIRLTRDLGGAWVARLALPTIVTLQDQPTQDTIRGPLPWDGTFPDIEFRSQYIQKYAHGTSSSSRPRVEIMRDLFEITHPSFNLADVDTITRHLKYYNPGGLFYCWKDNPHAFVQTALKGAYQGVVLREESRPERALFIHNLTAFWDEMERALELARRAGIPFCS